MQFVPRESIRQGPGRPKAPVAPKLVEALQQTLTTGTACVQDVAGETPEAIRILRRELRRAADHLGFKVHIQKLPGGCLAFYAEVPSGE